MRSSQLALVLLAGSAHAQTASIYEITAQNFAQASAQPVAWLLQLESPWSRTGVQQAALLRPVMQQAAQYFNSMYTSKGVRVGKVDLQQNAALRQAFCSGGAECPALVMMQNGRAQVYSGTGSLQDVLSFVERQTQGRGATSAAAQQQAQQQAQLQQQQALQAKRAQAQQQAQLQQQQALQAKRAQAQQQAARGSGGYGGGGYGAAPPGAPLSPKEALNKWQQQYTAAKKQQAAPQQQQQQGVKPKNTGATATTMHQMPKARQPMRAGSRRLNDPRLAYEDEDKDGRYRKRVVPLPEP